MTIHPFSSAHHHNLARNLRRTHITSKTSIKRTTTAPSVQSWGLPVPCPNLGCLSSLFGATQRAGYDATVVPRPLAILLPVSVDRVSQCVGVEPSLLVKHVPIGGYEDRGSGPVGVRAPHRLVERAVRVAHEVVREDYLRAPWYAVGKSTPNLRRRGKAFGGRRCRVVGVRDRLRLGLRGGCCSRTVLTQSNMA